MRINKIQILFSQIIVWIALTSTAPFIFYTWPGHPYKILTFGCVFSISVLLLIKNKLIFIKDPILKLITIQGFYYIIATLLYNDYSNYELCIQLMALSIIVIFIDNYIGFNRFVRSYINIMLIMGVGGVIIFLVHALIGISPIFETQYSEGGITYFLGLTSTNYYYNTENVRFLRFAGFFDEPGTFGLFSLFAILLNKIYFDNRKVEIYLIIVTLFTFSVAFYIIIAVYYFLFYFNRSNLKYLLLICLCIVAFNIYLTNYKGDNGTIIFLNNTTVGRFEINDNRIISVSERLDRGVDDKILFFENPFFGVQDINKIRGANFYSVFANHGLFGSLFYYVFLVYYLFYAFNLKGPKRVLFLKIFILIIANIIHRPEFSSLFILLLIYSMIKFMMPLQKVRLNFFNSSSIAPHSTS